MELVDRGGRREQTVWLSSQQCGNAAAVQESIKELRHTDFISHMSESTFYSKSYLIAIC